MMKDKLNLLIVEDEWISADYLSQVLEELGHTVVGIADSAEDALKVVSDKAIDFVFMDINIKGSQDGIMLARKLNQEKNLPVIYLTAYGDSDTIDEAATTNLYGFLIKPYTQNDVEAALHVANTRRKKEGMSSDGGNRHTLGKIDLGHRYMYDFHTNSLHLNNELVILSRNELKLLDIFCKHYNQIVTVETLKNEVWPQKDIGESTIRDTILRLRKKINPLHINNVTGIGYILKKEQ